MKDDQFIDYQDKIFEDAVFRLNARLSLLKQLNSSESASLWAMPVLTGILTVFRQALYDSLIVTLAWLYAEKSERGLIWYLNRVKEHSKTFSNNDIDTQLRKIKEKEEILTKVKTMRDKWIAHRDAASFNNRDEFLRKNRVNIEDLEILVELASQIIQEHFGEFQFAGVDFELPSTDISDLSKIVNERLELFEFMKEVNFALKASNPLEKIVEAKKKLSNF